MSDHHDFNRDKDTPESIRQMMNNEANAAVSKRGLPATERAGFEADVTLDDEAEAIQIHGAERAARNEFHKDKKSQG